jgi:hypothetical protein
MQKDMERTGRGPAFFWLLAVSAAVGALTVWQFTGRTRSPRLNSEVLSAARARWIQSGIQNYSMTVAVLGKETHRHEIEVRGGKVTRMLTDGVEAPERVWNFWSVDGIFTVLEEEIANAKAPQGPFGTFDPKDVFLDASFNSSTGVPIHYLRQVSGRSPMTLEWEIRDFRLL